MRSLFVSRRHMPLAVQRADERAFGWLAGRNSPVLERVLPKLSRAADHSTMWIAVAAALAGGGGRRGRTAAVRGLAALALASSVVNGPIKALAGRHRPDTALIPLSRRLRRVPWGSSFPSGHTASAAAFATAASIEAPKAAPALGVLAAGVAVSRVYTGAHYPTDVLAGAVLGAGAAAIARGLGPAPSERTEPPSVARTVAVGTGRGLVVGVNPAAGSPLSRDPASALAEAFPDARVIRLDGDPGTMIRQAIEPDTVAIVAAGGDGSVNALAAVAHEAGLPLGVIPAGTLNHLARDLGIDDVAAGIEAIAAGHVARIDVGCIAGTPFLNTASFAAYAEMVDEREALGSRIGKWPAALVSLWRVAGRPPVRVEIDGRPVRVRAIFIGNGRYSPGMLPSARLSLHDGRFDVRVLEVRRGSRVRALAAAGSGRTLGLSTVRAWTTDRLEIRSRQGPLRLARDGETFDGPERFSVEKARSPLEVFVPGGGGVAG